MNENFEVNNRLYFAWGKNRFRVMMIVRILIDLESILELFTWNWLLIFKAWFVCEEEIEFDFCLELNDLESKVGVSMLKWKSQASYFRLVLVNWVLVESRCSLGIKWFEDEHVFLFERQKSCCLESKFHLCDIMLE